MARQYYRIDTSAEAQQWIFQQEMPGRWQACQCMVLKFDLCTPGPNLRVVIDAVRFDEARGQRADDFLRLTREEIGKTG
jgi:hypothetical protein